MDHSRHQEEGNTILDSQTHTHTQATEKRKRGGLKSSEEGGGPHPNRTQVITSPRSNVLRKPSESVSVSLPHHHRAHKDLSGPNPVEHDLALAGGLVKAQHRAELILAHGALGVNLVAQDQERGLGQLFHLEQGLESGHQAAKKTADTHTISASDKNVVGIQKTGHSHPAPFSTRKSARGPHSQPRTQCR